MDIDHLDYVQFYPTTKCNLSCSFCFNRGLSSGKDIELEDYCTIVSALDDAGVKKMDMLGGEPTLHFGFEEMLEINARNGISTSISSNGRDVGILRQISSKYKKSLLKLGVSLYPETMTEELMKFIEEGLPVVKSVCTSKEFISKEGKRLIETGAVHYYLLFMDVLNKDDLDLSLPFPDYLGKLSRIKASYSNVHGVFCSGFIPDSEKFPVLERVRCPAGTTKMSILPDGSVYPCYLFFRHEEFRLGNLLFDDIQQIWNSPILDIFRSFKKNNCVNQKCQLHNECHGGCPAVSLLVHGDVSAPDPRCIMAV